MLKMNGGGIIDHQVGTGKTLIMCIYFLLYFGGLGYFPELVVCQDHAVPVVVLDVREYSDTLLRRKVLLARIQHSGIRIGPLERVGYVMHILLSPIIIGLFASPRRFISKAAIHMIDRKSVV